MKCIAYYPEDSMKEIANFCLKIINNKSKCAIFTESHEISLKLSQTLWNSYYFIPHGLYGENFWEIQPILISHNYQIDHKKANIINFEGLFVPETPVEKFIVWNHKIIDKNKFEVYVQKDQIWLKQ